MVSRKKSTHPPPSIQEGFKIKEMLSVRMRGKSSKKDSKYCYLFIYYYYACYSSRSTRVLFDVTVPSFEIPVLIIIITSRINTIYSIDTSYES